MEKNLKKEYIYVYIYIYIYIYKSENIYKKLKPTNKQTNPKIVLEAKFIFGKTFKKFGYSVKILAYVFL